MTRPLADLANDIDDLVAGTGLWHTGHMIADQIRAHTDVLDLVAKHLPPPPCDTCRGRGYLHNWTYDHDPSDHDPCPDPHCDHGRLALDVWLARVGAVWAAVWDDSIPVPWPIDTYRDDLRQVGRLP